MPEIDQLQIESNIDRILNRWPAVGLAVGIVRDGALRFFSSHGFANIESATPVTQDTVFRIASITKTFTAVAVMQLVEQRPDRPGCCRQRLSAGLPAGAGEGELAPRNRAASAHPHRWRARMAASLSHGQQRLVR